MSPQSIQRPKGTQDILPASEMPALNSAAWQFVENIAKRYMHQAGYAELRTPMFEPTELFLRGVGQETDIVNKEMYTFSKGDRSLTLRPENTAGVVRAYIENGMARWPKPVKVFYCGPMFRYERPQAGRQRQFHQFGIELFGLNTPAADAEVIVLAMQLFQALGLPNLCLNINNLGTAASREAFKQAFKQATQAFLPNLCGNCQQRFESNPLRMLDCKVPECQAIYAQPTVAATLEQLTDADSKAHFEEVLSILRTLEIPFEVNPRLVRGLDYYTQTVFEITSTHLGAQNAVCGGGRYDQLIETLGGEPTPAVGWALGLERLITLVPHVAPQSLDYYVVTDRPGETFKLAQQLRQAGLRTEVDLSGKPFGKQLAMADKRQARQVLIMGETERASQSVTIKTLQTGEQHSQSQQDFLQSVCSKTQETFICQAL